MQPSLRRPLVPLLSALAALVALPPASLAMSAPTPTAPAAAPAAPATADYAQALAKLRATIDERLAAINAGTEVPHRFDWTALDGQFDDFATTFRSLSAQDARNRLRSVANNLKSEEAKALVAGLGTALEAELAAADRARQAALEERFAAISRTALAAQRADELDPLINQLEDLQQEINEQRSPRQSRNHQLLNRQQNFLNNWQNLLMAAQDGDRQAIRNAESSINAGYSRPVGVDRSAIRARVRDLSASISVGDGEDRVILETLSLNNLGEVQARLFSLNESFGWNQAANARSQVITALDQLRAATLALQAGDTELALRHLSGQGHIIHHSNQSDSLVALQRLRGAWLERHLPAITGIPKLAPRSETEFPEPYLRRLVLAADAAGEHEQAIALARVLRRVEIRLPFFPTHSSPAVDDLAGAYEHFVAGRRLEAAGQAEEAAKSFRAALVAGAPAGLAAHLAERLKAN